MDPYDKATLRLAIGLGLAVLIAYGAALPVPFAVCVMAVILLCKPGPPMPLAKGMVAALFLGWFGPIGAAALYYAAFSLRETGIEEAWVVGSLVICASVLVHGVTATPLTKLYGRLPAV